MSRFMRSIYQKIDAYAPGEQPKVQNLIKLNTNESPYPPAPGVLDAIDRAAVERLRLYSDPKAQALVDAIAERFQVKPCEVAVGNGSDEVLAFAIQAFGEDGLVFPDITYGFYRVWADFYGLNKRVVPLTDDYRIDVDDYPSDAGMVILANPNAPTGKAISEGEIRTLLRKNPNHVVLIDEAYVDFGGQSAFELIREFENLLVVQTFSKSRALAGARVGFALGQEALIRDLSKVRYSFHPYNVTALSALAGAAAIRDEAYFDWTRRQIIETRERFERAMEGLGFRVMRSMANFTMVSPPALSAGEYADRLRARGILVRHFDQPRIDQFARISIGLPEEMERVVRASEEILKEARER